MSFVRPEARDAMWRWREALTGIALFCLGVWWVLDGGELLRWLGWFLIAGALALVVAGIQRGRFRNAGGGQGVVRTDEGQVAYFGPLNGGVVAVGDITVLSFDPSGKPQHWIFSQAGEPDLYVPLNAEGAEALFDVFTRLPGLKTEHLLQIMSRSEGGRVVLWRREKNMALPRA